MCFGQVRSQANNFFKLGGRFVNLFIGRQFDAQQVPRLPKIRIHKHRRLKGFNRIGPPVRRSQRHPAVKISRRASRLKVSGAMVILDRRAQIPCALFHETAA